MSEGDDSPKPPEPTPGRVPPTPPVYEPIRRDNPGPPEKRDR